MRHTLPSLHGGTAQRKKERGYLSIIILVGIICFFFLFNGNKVKEKGLEGKGKGKGLRASLFASSPKVDYSLAEDDKNFAFLPDTAEGGVI